MTQALQAHPVILPLIFGTLVLIPELTLLMTRHSQSHTANRVERKSLRYLWGTIISSILLAIPFGWYLIPSPLHYELSLRGILATFAVLLLGYFIRWWSILTLGKYFTVNVAIHSGHQLVRSGAYAWIRHPSYTGLLLELLSLAITFENIISIMIIMVPTTMALIQRIGIEERVLEKILREEYRQYQRKTYRLVPYLY